MTRWKEPLITDLYSPPAQTYATFEGEPLRPRRSFLSRFLLWTTAGTALFYGGSTVVALNNKDYQEWFSDSVPVSRVIAATRSLDGC